MESAPLPRHCQNCNEALTGPYCAACGQRDEERILPLKHLLHEVFHDIAHLDARFLGTLKRLLIPGALTQEYLEGRRVRWFPPFRLYLLISLAFFAVTSFNPRPGGLRITTHKPAQVISLDGQPVPESPTKSRLAKRAEEINRDPAAFYAKLQAWLPKVLFVLLPLFALLLKLAFLRTRTLFAVHAIFSLHEHAFAFLLFAVVALLDRVPYLQSASSLLLLYLPIHLVVGMKRIYRQGWFLSLSKAAIVSLLHLFLAASLLVATTVLLMLYS